MKYRLLGNSGLLVSELALGCMTFTGGARTISSMNKVDEADAKRLVDCALDAGVNYFDTADNYDLGQSEEVLGRVLGDRRKDVVIATKAGMRCGPDLLDSGLSRRHVILSVEGSLRRLGTDWIDLFIAHRPDPFTPLDEVLEAFDAVVRAGKVRYIGFSNWPAWMVAAALERQGARGLARFVNGQMYYSLVGRDVEVDTLPVYAEYGVGLTCWSPLASGFLSGKYAREDLKNPENRFGSKLGVVIDLDMGFRALEALRAIAGAHGARPEQVALAWLLAKRQVASVIVGASSLEQLRSNLAASDLVLSPEDIATLDAMTAPRRPYPYNYEAVWRDGAISKALAP